MTFNMSIDHGGYAACHFSRYDLLPNLVRERLGVCG